MSTRIAQSACSSKILIMTPCIWKIHLINLRSVTFGTLEFVGLHCAHTTTMYMFMYGTCRVCPLGWCEDWVSHMRTLPVRAAMTLPVYAQFCTWLLWNNIAKFKNMDINEVLEKQFFFSRYALSLSLCVCQRKNERVIVVVVKWTTTL